MFYKIIYKIYKLLFDKNKFSFENRILNFIVIIGVISFYTTALLNNIIGLSDLTVILTTICGTISTGIAYISIFKRNYNLAAFLFFAMTTFIFLPFMYFANGGLFGSIPYFAVMYSGVIAVLFKGVKKAIFVSLYIITLTALFYLELSYPSLIVKYITVNSQLVDVIISIYISVLLNIICLNFGVKSYSNENKRAEELNKRLLLEKEKLEKLSVMDGLTNIYNHRFIMEYLEAQIQYCMKNNKVLSAIFLDVDNFKKINDNYGHQVGDFVLKRISETIQGSLRDTDLAGRYGGEEFLIVLPSKSIEDSYRIAERIRREIEELQWDINIHVTLSGGVVELENERIHQLLDKADYLLYKAKRLGKNRIEKAS